MRFAALAVILSTLALPALAAVEVKKTGEGCDKQYLECKVYNLEESVKKLQGEMKYGGSYQATDPGVDPANATPNPVTGHQTCPEGYEAHKVGRVRTAEPGPTGVGADLFACIKPKS